MGVGGPDLASETVARADCSLLKWVLLPPFITGVVPSQTRFSAWNFDIFEVYESATGAVAVQS